MPIMRSIVKLAVGLAAARLLGKAGGRMGLLGSVLSAASRSQGKYATKRRYR
ncbi:hypothetical protein GCM10027188_10970 [Lysobacter humi (ex Lee et al. 2017)]